MRSQNVEKFNHDEEAHEYDQDIENESDPIRTGYHDLLSWVATKSNESHPKRVLDLGVGTGNLSLLLHGFDELVCVDTSSKMIEIAQNKIGKSDQVQFKKADLLEYFNEENRLFDSIVSTYAIHHLTESEKDFLFSELYQSLTIGGIVVVGDLMFKNQEEESKIFKQYRLQGNENLIDDIKDEYFWYLDSSVDFLKKIGFETFIQQFSDLSWGVYAKRN